MCAGEKIKISILPDASTKVKGFHGKVGLEELAAIAEALGKVGVKLDLQSMKLAPGVVAHTHDGTEHVHEDGTIHRHG